MINLISEVVINACSSNGLEVKFVRIPDKCKPFMPYFVFDVKGYSAQVGLDTKVLHDNEKPISIFINELVATIIARINQIVSVPNT